MALAKTIKNNVEMSWEKVRLGDVAKNLDNIRKPLNENERNKINKKGLYPYIGANNIMGYVDEYLFDEEIICVAEDGGSWGENEKCASYFNEKCWVNNHSHVLGNNGKADLKYLLYFLNKENLNNYITGSTRGKLTKSALENILIPLPPLATQKRIADILDTADALRRKDQELLTKYDQLAQAIFIDMFGDPVKNEKGWEVKKISEIGKVQTGNTPPRVNKAFYGDYIEWIKTDNILLDEINPRKSTEFLSELGLKKGRYVDKGSVLVTCIAGSPKTIGNVCLTNRKVAFNQQINSCTPNSNYNNIFVYSLFRNCKSLIQESTTQGMKRIITKSVFEKIQFISPPKKLQDEYDVKYNLLNKQKEIILKQNSHSTSLFSSLIQQAFNGTLVS